MAVWLSLLAALTYGCSDFVGGVTSQRAPAWSVALMAQVGGGLAVLLVAVAYGGEPTRADLGWALLAGVGNGAGTAFLYRGLSSGRMGVIAPASGVTAAVLPVAVGLGLGERPGLVVWLGLTCAVPAIWLVSREPAPAAGTAEPEISARRGLADGLIAGAGFGLLFVALAQIPARAGLLPLAVNQLVGAVVIVLLALVLRVAWVPRSRASYAGVGCGVLGASATLLFLVASRQGYLSVTAVLTSLYPAFTVLLAALVLRERIHRTQGLGLALCALAVALVAAG